MVLQAAGSVGKLGGLSTGAKLKAMAFDGREHSKDGNSEPE